MDESRIVLIRGNNSEWYEQAIFVLKSPKYAKTKNLVQEAEKIINEYMLSGGAAVLTPKLEKYKRSVFERTAAKRGDSSAAAQETPPVKEYAPRGYAPPVKKTVVRKTDPVTILLSAGLVAAGVMLGYLMHRLMLP